jgi:hypothetical protein
MVLILWSAHSDERSGLSLLYAAGPRQRSLSRARLRFETSLFVTSYDSQGHKRLTALIIIYLRGPFIFRISVSVHMLHRKSANVNLKFRTVAEFLTEHTWSWRYPMSLYETRPEET